MPETAPETRTTIDHVAGPASRATWQAWAAAIGAGAGAAAAAATSGSAWYVCLLLGVAAAGAALAGIDIGKGGRT